MSNSKTLLDASALTGFSMTISTQKKDHDKLVVFFAFLQIQSLVCSPHASTIGW
ncbi:hypothetical protein [Fibrobacter sp. UWB11]|uniref:hypothetical protein n=1 Tax=Fibrobacter sp. UWB11 TaxID=1896202 RepID=UPI001588146E|nr:hypothetical protein [Fibrobacter sp. UWB11]